MKCYFLKLIPPRPTFPADISPREAELMGQHAAYWRQLLDQDRAIAAGPVLDPAGTYGVALIRLADDQDPEALVGQDPVILGQAGFRWEIRPMLSLMVKG
jgi:uncharacterized protein YciI